MTVVTRPNRDSAIPIVYIISITGEGVFEMLCGLILSEMSYKKASRE